MQQMEWREALDEARSVDAVEALRDERRARTARDALAQLEQTARRPPHDHAAAAQQVRALMFIERFAHDVDQRLEALGQ